LRQRTSRLHKEVWQERTRIQRVIPVDLAWVIAVEPDLHDDGPNVDTEVEKHDGKETDLCTTTLANTLEIEYETQTETTDDTEEWRDEGGKSAGADAKVGSKIGRPCPTDSRLAAAPL